MTLVSEEPRMHYVDASCRLVGEPQQHRSRHDALLPSTELWISFAIFLSNFLASCRSIDGIGSAFANRRQICRRARYSRRADRGVLCGFGLDSSLHSKWQLDGVHSSTSGGFDPAGSLVSHFCHRNQMEPSHHTAQSRAVRNRVRETEGEHEGFSIDWP